METNGNHLNYDWKLSSGCGFGAHLWWRKQKIIRHFKTKFKKLENKIVYYSSKYQVLGSLKTLLYNHDWSGLIMISHD